MYDLQVGALGYEGITQEGSLSHFLGHIFNVICDCLFFLQLLCGADHDRNSPYEALPCLSSIRIWCVLLRSSVVSDRREKVREPEVSLFTSW